MLCSHHQTTKIIGMEKIHQEKSWLMGFTPIYSKLKTRKLDMGLFI